MSTLAQKFAAYRKSGAKRVEEPIQWTKLPYNERPLYEQTGFLSNEETGDERADRLVTAQAQGFRLSLDDHRWLRSHTAKYKRWLKENDGKVERRAERERAWIGAFTRNIVGGFG